MGVYVVTVTYGDRFEFLKQVIEASLREGVDKIIVVDNASAESSRDKLRELEKLYKDKIKVVYLDENTGSAGGFKRGLEEAYKCSDSEFIWLLDDDNMPLEGSLKALIDFWNSLEDKNKEENIALLSYRFKSLRYAERTKKLKNSFLGFHIRDIYRKIYRYLQKLFKLNRKLDSVGNKNNGKKFVIIPVVPYGGLFFHKKILDKIGFPNEDFYLYTDDIEWTYRITKSGGKIYLVLDSLLDDLAPSWNTKSNKETSFAVIAKGDPLRVYYTVRNSVFFETRNIVNNKIIYWINIIVYLFLITLISRKNIKIIIKAIRDGLKGNLGKRELQEITG